MNKTKDKRLKKIGNNKWRARIDIKSNGRRNQKCKTFWGTGEEANEKMLEWINELNKENTKDYIIRDLIKEREKYCDRQVKSGKMQETTRDWYKHVSKRIEEKLGNIRAKDITLTGMENFFEFLLEEDLGSKYQYEHFNYLKTVFNYACEKEMIPNNPIKKFTKTLGFSRKPKNDKPKIFEDDEIEILLRETKDKPPLNLVIPIALETGMRRNEILALRWEDIDFNNNLIKVKYQLIKKNGKFVLKKTKTDNSVRAISMTEFVRELLYKESKRQKKHCMETGLGVIPFVVTNEAGGLFRGDYISACFLKVLKELDKGLNEKGMPQKWVGRGIHCLRHTFASKVIQSGGKVTDLAYILGHHSADLTLRVYTHTFNDSPKETMKKFDEHKKKEHQKVPSVCRL